MATHRFRGALRIIKHITFTNKLVCAFGIKYSTTIHYGLCAESNSCWDVGFNRTGNNLNVRTLGRQNHMHTNRTCFLRDTLNRTFYFFSGLHNKVSVLVNNNNEIRHVVMVQDFLGYHVFYWFFRIKHAGIEFLVVILHISAVGISEKRVTILHLNHQGVERVNHFLAVRNDDISIFLVGHSCHVMFEQRFINGKFDHFRIHKYKLQFCRMFFV